jgi:hypothetical protein
MGGEGNKAYAKVSGASSFLTRCKGGRTTGVKLGWPGGGEDVRLLRFDDKR